MAPRYSNPDPRHGPHGMRAVFRWGVLDRLSGRRERGPAGPGAPRVAPDRAAIEAGLGGGAPRVTWIGHASFLGSLGDAAFLVDPVFSERAGLAYRRAVAPGLRASELPPLDALLVSHCHYDHLDRASIRALPPETPAVAPLGVGRWLHRFGLRRVVELAWWESVESGRLTVTLVPARHWSRRSIADTNATLWGGFVIRRGDAAIYHAGDSAWFDGFAEIGRRFPGLLAALLPVGSYAPAWFMEHYHLNPEQAGRAFLALGARHFVAMHWGTFRLTDEPLREPAQRVRDWWKREGPRDGRRLHVPAVGETVVLDG